LAKRNDVELPINFQFKHPNGHHLLIIREFLIGQWRLQLCFQTEELIVREACTYKREVAVAVKDAYLQSGLPEVYFESLSKPWNCEGPEQRIRLDNTAPRAGSWPLWKMRKD
jgi:hypothetical protein